MEDLLILILILAPRKAQIEVKRIQGALKYQSYIQIGIAQPR
jgi:hypothetical protein